MRSCEECAGELARRRDARFCSDACRQRAWRRRAMAAAAEVQVAATRARVRSLLAALTERADAQWSGRP